MEAAVKFVKWVADKFKVVQAKRQQQGRSMFKKSDRSYSGLDYHFEKFRDEKKNGI